MLRRAAIAIATQARSYATKAAQVEVYQGKQRMELDQPARWNRWREQYYNLNDDERELYMHEPIVGVCHLYEPHIGSKERCMFSGTLQQLNFAFVLSNEICTISCA